MPDVREELKEAMGLPTKEQLAVAQENFKAELPDVKKRLVVPLSALRPSPTNPRRKFTGIDELAATMESMGVISSLVVRPLADDPNKYEIIAGGRRYLAAKKAGLKEVPIEIRMMTDSQVAEVQLVENGQREDLLPIEEAEGFERLRDDHHYSVAQIAAKVGKSKGHVHARLKLLALCPEARKAMDDGRLDATVAVPLARIGSHAHQAKALVRIAGMSSREAVEFLTREFTQTLKGSPFDQKDPDLLPLQKVDGGQIGGSCVKCPNRSGSAPGLFDDIKGHDTCTTPSCFQQKCARAWKASSAAAVERGTEALSIPEGKKLFDHSNELTWDSPYVLANAPADGDPSKRTWRQLASKLPEAPQVFLIPDKHLKGRECFKREEVLRLLAPKQKWAAKEVKEDRAKERRATEPAAWEKEQAKRRAREVVLEMLVDKGAHGVEVFELPHLRLIAMAMHHDARGGASLKRRNLTDATAEKWITEEATAAQLCTFVYEYALQQFVGNAYQGFSDEAKAMAARLKIDLKEQERFAAQQLEADTVAVAAELNPPADETEVAE